MASTPSQVDDFLLEQPFPLSWLEMVGVNRTAWDFNGGSSGITSSSTGLSTGLRYEASELQESIHQFQRKAVVHFPFEDISLPNGVQKPCVQEDFDAARGVSAGPPSVRESLLSKDIHESFCSSISQGTIAERGLGLLFNPSIPSIADSTASRLKAPVTYRAPGLLRSPSVSSSGSDGPGFQQSSPWSQCTPEVAAAWQQSYLRGALQPRPDVAQANGDSFFIYESMPDDPISQATGLSMAGLPDSSSGGAQVGSSQKTQFEPGQQCQQQVKEFQSQGGHGSLMPSYETQGVAQPQGTAAAMLSGTTKPRQRARRGQATDPHSIAERLRRERIAERMKALQELVPNSNKTDKASMLDEIVEYVKFLQLQVKVLSMSRLGGAGAVAPLIADLPVEGQNSLMAAALGWNAGSSNPPPDAMTLIERQVARLMEEDMGSAMRFLQGRGLCLMPVSLATTIFATNSRSTGGVRDLTVLDRSQIDASSSTTVGAGRTSSTLPSIGIIPSSSDCFDGGSEPILEGVQTKEDKCKLQSSIAERTYSAGLGLPLCATAADIADGPKQG